jgi:hypothetical protein
LEVFHSRDFPQLTPPCAVLARRVFFVFGRWNPAAWNRINCHQTSAKTRKQDLIAMPKENDLEGAQDQGGKHGGHKGMPKPEPRAPGGNDQGIVRDERGQEQPRDKARARQVSRQDRGGDPPGEKA